jgi:hypothetical protein
VKIYSLYDEKAEAFGTPFCALNEGVSKRMFDRLLRDADSMVSQYPDDYVLYEIGAFDDQKGYIDGYDKPKRIGKGYPIDRLEHEEAAAERDRTRTC